MKKIFILFILLILSAVSFAQTRGTHYCEVIFKSRSGKKNSIKTDFTINLGDEDGSYSSLSSLSKSEQEKLKSLHTTIGILNYMASIGWVMVNMNTKDEDEGTLYFRKEGFSARK